MMPPREPESMHAPAPSPALAPRSRREELRQWVADHDERWLFTLLYVGLAVVLSIWISLFWLLAVVAAHGVLEWWALQQRGGLPRGAALRAITWHLKLDITLVLFALWLGVYLETLFGVAGLGPLARSGAQAGSRFLAWQKALRGALMTLDDAAQVARAVAARRRHGNGVPIVEASAPASGWTKADWLIIGSGAMFAALIVAAPWLTAHDTASVVAALAADLHPWPR